ncbi:hypothetical protein AVEN_73852-1 [Araneus ventricosus]|uniref:Uncharacterized protein n=1 Tax=Araneus ventricosus TaxID=182803 RepID=A0A4Y2GBR3_ARAVE|nr:hypothetical protein AVEN_73852-1 [Araneus ventricosus]
MRIEKEDMAKLLQLQKEDFFFEVKTVPHPLVSDVEEDTRRKSINSQMAESLATENIKRKIDKNDFRQVKTLDNSYPLNVEEDFSQSRCCDYKRCDSSTLEKHIFNAEMCIKDPENKNAENSESKCEAMDTSETLIN